MQVRNRNLHRLQQTLSQGFANVDNQFTAMNNNMANLTSSINDLVWEMVADRAHERNRESNTAARFDRLSQSIGRLATTTTCLSRRTIKPQVELGHFAGDVARGLGCISHAVDLIETTQAARGIGDIPRDSEDISSISRVSASDARILQSSSARQGSGDPLGLGHGGRSRRRV
ncbi:hypothetical protein NDU88_002340 [Pleurodeles waltl]|uniref:Uncharacterized protein n=1 Tax=Pleurodeles waltl TaxID=8319 RepID=A0AAV7PBD2_PLEWA|nr:hypothetical protein NDU88_002340 [Pleurodeles waltl]